MIAKGSTETGFLTQRLRVSRLDFRKKPGFYVPKKLTTNNAYMTQLTLDTSTVTPARIGGSVHTYQWRYQGQEFPLAYETRGQGTPVLLLPAFSTVSTRGEMSGLADCLPTNRERDLPQPHSSPEV